MNLVIDIGNTNTKTGLVLEGSAPVVETVNGIPDTGYFERLLDRHPSIRHGILSSVVHHPPELEKFLASRMKLLTMDENTRLPLISLYKTPDTLGRDRIAAATGGQSLFPGHDVLVINAGTCITYDFVTGNREYAGGSISPGMMMRFRALHTFTGKLPLLSPDETEILTGNSTESSIQSGVMEGITAEMEGITGKYRSLYPELKVVLSGGDLNYFVNRLKINIFAFPNIVIQGLHQILKFNVDNPY